MNAEERATPTLARVAIACIGPALAMGCIAGMPFVARGHLRPQSFSLIAKWAQAFAIATPLIWLALVPLAFAAVRLIGRRHSILASAIVATISDLVWLFPLAGVYISIVLLRLDGFDFGLRRWLPQSWFWLINRITVLSALLLPLTVPLMIIVWRLSTHLYRLSTLSPAPTATTSGPYTPPRSVHPLLAIPHAAAAFLPFPLSIGMILAAYVTQFDEPFGTWGHYVGEGANIATTSTTIIAIPLIALTLIAIRCQCTRRSLARRAAFAAGLRLWWLVLLTTPHTFAVFLQAAITGEAQPMNGARIPGVWHQPIAILAWPPLIVPILIISLIPFARHTARTLRFFQHSAASHCPTCGYPRPTPTTTRCPECGSELVLPAPEKA